MNIIRSEKAFINEGTHDELLLLATEVGMFDDQGKPDILTGPRRHW